MLRSILLVLLVAVCVPASGDIIGGDYNISGNAGFNTAVNFPASGSFTAGTPVSVTEPLVATTGFNFSGGILDLNVDVLFAGVLATPLTWTFSTLNLGGETITDVTQTGGPLATVTPGLNSITIQTPTDLSGLLNAFSFSITDTGSAAVPEPSSIAMLCVLGVGGVWVRRRRQSVA